MKEIKLFQWRYQNSNENTTTKLNISVCFKEDLMLITPKLFHKIETEETFPNLFYQAIVNPRHKPHKTQKRITDQFL